MHEPKPEWEKLVNGGAVQTSRSMEVETRLPSEKGLKRWLDVVDLEGESSQSSKRKKVQRGGTKAEDFREDPSTKIGFQLQIGGAKCAPSSPIPRE